MKLKSIFKNAGIILAASTITFSCTNTPDEANPDDGNTSQESSKYVVGLQSYPVGTEQPIDYVLGIDKLDQLVTGELSIEGKGITQSSWQYYHSTDDRILTAGYAQSADAKKCKTYGYDENGKLKEIGNFKFDNDLQCFTTIDKNTVLAVDLGFSGYQDKKFYFINTQTGLLEKVIEHPIDIVKGDGTETNPGSIPWVTGMVQSNGKLFVSYFKFDGIGGAITLDTDKAFIAIFKYPEMVLEKRIEDTRTGSIGIHGHNTGIQKTENGDIYSYSSTSLTSGFTSSTKKSGILRIKNGASEFDKDYFFDVESAANGGKIFWMDYVGNGKAIARIVLDDTKHGEGEDKNNWYTYTSNDNLKLVVLDLNAKTVTDVSGAPTPHGKRYAASLFVENGKAYVTCATGDFNTPTSYVYIVDPESATATKGAKVLGKGLKGIFKLK